MTSPVVGVVGLGYVGLPLAVEFGKHFPTIGFDVNESRVAAFRDFRDPNGEISGPEFSAATCLECTTDPARLRAANFIVVAVPTPVDKAKQPDLSPLIRASRAVGAVIGRGTTVVYESTVYPGATEEFCIPLIESESGYRWKRDFFVGYSPERINPGDRERTLTKIVKVVSGDTPGTLERVGEVYGKIIPAGIYKAPSIRVAEAAKVIENTQRDLNIALMNELALIFDRLGLSTSEVLAAAGTKWNFLNFKPGLVGGHCIGVDPYYLTHKAEMVGYQPQVILAGRRINDGMSKFVAEKTIKLMIQRGVSIKGAKVNILGLTFKEDCPDLRNSRVPEIVRELIAFGVEVHIHDPICDAGEALQEYGLSLTAWDDLPQAAATVIAVGHRHYRDLAVEELVRRCGRDSVLVDVKAIVDGARWAREAAPDAVYWRL